LDSLNRLLHTNKGENHPDEGIEKSITWDENVYGVAFLKRGKPEFTT
jgi:hypothetical protein